MPLSADAPGFKHLVLQLTWGADQPERVSQAFAVAAAAVAGGRSVSLWLSGDASLLALPGAAEEVQLDQAPPLAELRDLVLAEGTVTVCGPCATRRDLTAADFLPGVRLAGAAAFVEEALAQGAQALVY